jgi:1,4-alpha-glucan branching enzyme
VDNPDLRYAGLNAFDQAMLGLDKQFGLLPDPFIEQLALHENEKLLVYRRGPLVFAVNLHSTNSYADLRVPVPDSDDYRVVLDADAAAYAGPDRTGGEGVVYPLQSVPHFGRGQSIQIYLPSRSAQVLAPCRLAPTV